ncbi:hypothetical protein G9P44_000077 [Scheffersomyces stipitis]|nr:hypothetical protein G9P44_000077 [Scheffersomyces stipitis]
MATFNTYKVKIRNGYMTIFKVRLYCVPADVRGFRYIHEWRNSKPRVHLNEKNYKKYWSTLLQYLDYSVAGWNIPQYEVGIGQFVKQNSILIDMKANASSNVDLTSVETLNYHIHRWTSNNKCEPFRATSNVTHKSKTLADRIQDIYNGISSPDVSVYQKKSVEERGTTPNSKEVLVQLLNSRNTGDSQIDGVKTELYTFQIRSIAKMYEKEVFPQKALSPNFVELRSPSNGFKFYFHLQSYFVHIEPEIYSLPRGGILAENMGLGKTLICLSLICLTKNDISQIPNDLLIHDPMEEPELQELILDENDILRPINAPRPQQVKSLSELCKQCVNQNSLPWRYYASDLPQSVVQALLKDPGYFQIPLVNKEYESQFSQRSRKPSTRQSSKIEEGYSFRTLFLCNTTLIIVPDNLFHQWNTELNKHIQPGFLSKLFISSQFRKEIITSRGTYTNVSSKDPRDLIKYDLVIMTHSYLARQFGELSSEENPLNKIYWKRLIIDEGHSMNSKSSKTSNLCKVMQAERRWAVTGTPTSGLTKLYMDEEQNETDSATASPKKKSKYVVKSSFNEKEDLVKLGTIVGNFLKIEPFHSRPKLWTKEVIQPLVSKVYGSDVSLSNLLNAIVVRHNSQDIESDLKLPQLHHEAVYIEPSYHNKISINLFTAVLAVNAVSSERTDIDYMFHPSNRQQLRRLITNLQRATFHWTGFQQDDVETLIHICNVSLKKRRANGQSVYDNYDVELLMKSLEAAKFALSNTRWRTSALLHEMNYFVTGLPDAFIKSFGTGMVERIIEGEHDDIGVFGAPHLNAIQEFYYKNRFLVMEDEELLKSKLEFASKPFWASYWIDSVRRNNERFKKQDQNQNFESNVKNGAIANAINVPDVVRDYTPEYVMETAKFSTPRRNSVSKKSQISPKNELTEDGLSGLVITKEVHSGFSIRNENIRASIREARILGTASAKLSYLGSRLLEHQRNKIKSLIFFEFEDSAYYLTELLDVLGVNYILYATFINPAERARNLSLFSEYITDEQGGITLIMDLRLAAHGLTIVEATHVYFMSPVWQRSIEAQAIKRAHRIGQTKDVHVETLVLRGTLEEEIYKRRTSNTDDNEEDEGSKRKYVIDDTGMQEYILRHRFLDYSITETEYAPFVSPTTMHTNNDVEEEDSEFSLLNHRGLVVETNRHGFLHNWDMFLFTNDNLTKFNKLKAEKAQKEHVESLYMDRFVQSETKPIKATRKRLTIKIDKDIPSKKVRF